MAARQLGGWVAKNKKSLAFTLAEVLITLAIIGVVAALTIPTVVAKYQQKQYYTQFMKSYNTLSNVLHNSIAENGPVWEWSDLSDKLDLPNSDIMDKYFLPYLKVATSCKGSDLSKCFGNTYKKLNGQDDYTISDGFSSDDRAYVLADGNTIALVGHHMKPWNPKSNDTGLYFLVDTNGVKGPNVKGRDLFLFTIWGKEDDDGNFITSSLSTVAGEEQYISQTKDVLDSAGSATTYYKNCTLDTSDTEDCDSGCVDRLLLEGKMDY